MDGEKTIRSHFQMPHKEIAKIRKAYKTANDALETMKGSMDPEKFKNFEAEALKIFDFFEELTGKSVNRTIMVSHISYYLDEGFEVEEMKNYLRAQVGDLWYKQNPEMFTIARLFPIRDQDRINITWDLLAFHQSQLVRFSKGLSEVFKGVQIKRPDCQHLQSLEDFRSGKLCEDEGCRDSLLSCMVSPYEAISKVSTEPLRELSYHFMRQNEESVSDYVKRTYSKRVEVMTLLKMKPPKLENLIGLLK